MDPEAIFLRWVWALGDIFSEVVVLLHLSLLVSMTMVGLSRNVYTHMLSIVFYWGLAFGSIRALLAGQPLNLLHRVQEGVGFWKS